MKTRIENQKKLYFQMNNGMVQTRKNNLRAIENWIKHNRKRIYKALYLDLGKSPFEVFETELLPTLNEIKYLLKNLDHLSATKKVRSPLFLFKAKSKIEKKPYGQVLIMAPWNYPFQLALSPMVSALAAGNCVVLKPSEISENTSTLLKSMFDELNLKYWVEVVEGDVELTQELLDMPFDYIFFTGSTEVGKIVMKKASEHLTPVTLELGGKSPCIVDESAKIHLAAKRIVWGKFLNSGQTCVAPDYILVDRKVKESLIDSLEYWIDKYVLEQMDTYPKIISEKHINRLRGLVDGQYCLNDVIVNASNQFLPILVDEPALDSKLMKEEIFGPILPIVSYTNLEEAIEIVQSKPHPLALYLFSQSKKTQELVLDQLQFGGATINDTIMHLASHHLPFGGVGASGMGNYHGKYGFETFTHNRSVMNRATWIDVPLRYAPYGWKLKILEVFFG